jgi:hypothetical protein
MSRGGAAAGDDVDVIAVVGTVTEIVIYCQRRRLAGLWSLLVPQKLSRGSSMRPRTLKKTQVNKCAKIRRQHERVESHAEKKDCLVVYQKTMFHGPIVHDQGNTDNAACTG